MVLSCEISSLYNKRFQKEFQCKMCLLRLLFSRRLSVLNGNPDSKSRSTKFPMKEEILPLTEDEIDLVTSDEQKLPDKNLRYSRLNQRVRFFLCTSS